MEAARRAAVGWLMHEGTRGPLGAYLRANWAARFGLVGVG